MRCLVISSVVSLKWTDTSLQGTYELEIHMFWIGHGYLKSLTDNYISALSIFETMFAFTDIMNNNECDVNNVGR